MCTTEIFFYEISDSDAERIIVVPVMSVSLKCTGIIEKRKYTPWKMEIE